MSDTILGVIIGGVIGSVVPLATLAIGHFRWKREAKLQYLKSERERLEKMFDNTLRAFSEGMAKNSYSSDMSSDIMVFMPKDVTDKFIEFIRDTEKTPQKCKSTYMDLAMAMKKVIKDMDAEIRELLS